MSINSVNLTGFLSTDCELRATTSGYAVCTFSVCVSDSVKNKQTGEYEDYPNFIDCVLYGKLGESLSPYLNKGSKVSIKGRLHQQRWKDKDTDKSRSRLEVVCESIELMSRNGSQDTSNGYQTKPKSNTKATKSTQEQFKASVPNSKVEVEVEPDLFADEDIPF